VALLAFPLAGCGGGAGGDGGPTAAAPVVPAGRPASAACRRGAAHPEPGSVRGAGARRVATIAVVDRSGNVPAVFQTGAAALSHLRRARGHGRVEGVNIVPSGYAAISKAVTGAYLSSGGNAFTTRTASQIAGESGRSTRRAGRSSACSSPSFRAPMSLQMGLPSDPSPRRSASATPKWPAALQERRRRASGHCRCATALDPNIGDIDEDWDRSRARGFDAPAGVRADRITADGRTFRLSTRGDVFNPGAAPDAGLHVLRA
jgi:hypothetical protein